MWIVLTTALVLAAGPPASVTTLGGQQVAGQVLRASTDEIVLNTADGEQSFAATEILSLKLTAAESAPRTPARVWIELIDGSQLQASECAVAKGVARATLLGGQSIDIPTRSLQTVRLQDHESELAQQSRLARQWRDLLATPATADVIVIRKVSVGEDDAAPMTAVLDTLEGVLGDITEDKVQFTYDQQTIPVDRNKVEGLVYFHPAGRELPDPLCRIDDVAGNRWNVKSLTLAGDTLQFVSTSGVKTELPLTRIATLDYSAGKILFLSDIEPDTAEWTNAYGDNGATAGLSKMFAPRRDQSFGGDRLVLDGKSYEKGLALHSRTVVEYRLQGKFSKFLALAGIDDKVRPAGDVQLVVSLDGKRLGEHRIRGKDSAAVPLQYDIRGGRKLTLTVDFGGGLDVSDRLHLVNARVTK